MPMYKPEAHGQLLKLSKVRRDHPPGTTLLRLTSIVSRSSQASVLSMESRRCIPAHHGGCKDGVI